jgi:hypothetical protein
MESSELPGIFPVDTWVAILSLTPAHIGIMCNMTTKYLHATFSNKKSFWDLMWRKSGLSLPKEYNSVSSKQKFANINEIMKVDASTVTAATVDQARISRLDCSGFPHGSSTVVTTHSEEIPYSYTGSAVLCGNFWDLSDWPSQQAPTSAELGPMYGAVDTHPMFLVGKTYLGQMNENRSVDFSDVKTFELTSTCNFVPPGTEDVAYFNASPNMNSDYPWSMVTCGFEKTHVSIFNVEKQVWTSDKPIIIPFPATALSISFYGRWIAVVISSTRVLQLWKLDPTGAPPKVPQLTASLVKFPCSLERDKIQLAVSLHQLVLFYIRQGSDQHARLLTVPIDASFGDKFQLLLDQAEAESVVFDCVDPSQTSTLFVTATTNLIFASIRQDLFVLNAFSKKIMMVVRANTSIMSIARAVDSGLFILATESTLAAVDLLGRETGYKSQNNRVAFYKVFINAKKKVRVEEQICRGAWLIDVVQRALPQDKAHGIIDHQYVADPSTPNVKHPTVLMLTRSPMRYPGAPGQSVIQATWVALMEVSRRFADPYVRIMTVEQHLDEAQIDLQLAQIVRSPTWMPLNAPPVPDAILIRHMEFNNDNIPWTLEKATKAAEALAAAGILKPGN